MREPDGSTGRGRIVAAACLAFSLGWGGAIADEYTLMLEFTDSGQVLGSANSLCVAVEDVDGDGDGDAVVANTGSPSMLWLNDGKGRFTAGTDALPSAECVLLADLDTDGDADAFLVGDELITLLNDGFGHFKQVGAPINAMGTVDADLGDIDGDKDIDVVTATWGHPSGLPNRVWRNEGNGRFVQSPSTVGASVSGNVVLADMDGDGDPDVLVANQADANHDPIPDELWLNDGKGSFTDSGLRLGRSCTYAIRAADLDGDGDLDAITANSSHAGKSEPANTVWLNDGRGRLQDSGQRLGTAYSLGVELGDLDGDGDLDAYVGNYQQGDRIWLNDGSGRFAATEQLLGTQNGHDVALADLDGDGDLDAFVVNNTWQGGDGANRVWLNAG